MSAPHAQFGAARAAPPAPDVTPSRARRELVEKLCEVVTWPASRIALHERDLAGDLLLNLLPSCDLPARVRLAQRLAQLSEAPKALQRYLVRDHIDVAAPLLKEGVGLDDSDLISAISEEAPGHARALCQRRTLSPLVCEALVKLGLAEVTAAVLKNQFAVLSSYAMEQALRQSMRHAHLQALIATRAELRASQALAMFWWVDGETRAVILRRFAVDRAILIGELGDVFLTAHAERWQDTEARKALLMVERRTRTRTDSKGETASLEAVLSRLAVHGFDAATVAEIAHQTSLRAVTALRIFQDPGGEALAVFAKASGVRREQLEAMWLGLRGAYVRTPEGQQAWDRTRAVFETLSTAKAQGVLRIWNWGLGPLPESNSAE